MAEDEKKGGASGFLFVLVFAACAYGLYLGFRDPGYGETNEYAFLGPTIILGVVFGIAGSIVGGNKEMGGSAGWWWGFLLGPIGLIVVAVSPSAGRVLAPTGSALGASVGPSTLAPPPPGTQAGWLADPTTRFEHRYWDGGRWTEHVHGSTGQHTDPIG